MSEEYITSVNLCFFVVLNHNEARGIKLQVTSVLCAVAVVLLHTHSPVILRRLMFWDITTRLVITECFSILPLGDKTAFWYPSF